MKKETVKYYIDADKPVEQSNFYADLKDGKCVVFSLVDLTCNVKKIKKLKNLNLVEISLDSYKILLDKFSMLCSLEGEQEDVDKSQESNTTPSSEDGSDSFVFSNEGENDDIEDESDNFVARTKLIVSTQGEKFVGYSQREEEELGVFIAQLIRSGDPMIISGWSGKFKYVIGPESLKNSSIELVPLYITNVRP